MPLNKSDLKILALTSVVVLSIAAVLAQFVMTSPIFKIKAKEGQSYNWDGYEKDRDFRNILKMKRSYGDLMIMAENEMKKNNLNRAMSYYFDAKTIFPNEIAPRKNLCYAYLLRCQYDPEFCKRAKMEIYYALKYVGENDSLNRDYLEQLAVLVDMEAWLDLPEQELLAQIY